MFERLMLKESEVESTHNLYSTTLASSEEVIGLLFLVLSHSSILCLRDFLVFFGFVFGFGMGMRLFLQMLEIN